jgi:capsular exopolysaccharide synthesis family protein
VSVGANAITATVWEPATLPETPVSPDPIRNGIIALVMGSLLGVVLAFLLEYVNDSWNSRDEVEEVSGVPTVGVIPKFTVSARRKGILASKEGEQDVARFRSRRQAQNDKVGALSEQLVTVLDPIAMASEAYRSLRTSLLYAVADTPPTVILITSPGLMDGKSTTCANLASALAQAGKETLVVDGDLRQPSLHKIFGVPNVNGMVDVLSGEYDLSEVCTEPFPGLKILATGPIPPNPAEHLISGRFAQLIGQARRSFDYVLVDSPPTELVSDPMIIAAHADAVFLVLDSEKSSKGSLRGAMQHLEAVGANILGTVINRAPKPETRRYGYSN